MDTRTKTYSPELSGERETDVVVVGGGPAGILAALSARRNGADVLVLERESYLGGMNTGAMVYTWFKQGYTTESSENTDGNPAFVRGIAEELFEALAEADALDREGQLEYGDPALAAGVYEDVLNEANVDVLYNTFAFDAVVEDDEIEGVVVANKSGGQVVWADRVVDTSGDGDIAAAAGVPCEFGREEDGRCHGGALLMEISGIDLDRFFEYMSADHDITEDELARIEAEKSRLFGAGGPPNAAVTPDGEETDGYGHHQPRDWEQMKKEREEGRPLNWSIRGGPSGLGATYEYEGDVPPEVKFDREWIEFVKEGRVPQWLGAKDDIYPPPMSIGMLGYGSFKNGKRRYDTMLTGIYEAWFDHTDQGAVSDAIQYMRKVNRCYLEFLNERIPGFEDAYIATEAPSVGKRESRRIVGEYVLTAEDETEGRRFDDAIAKSGHPPSAHSLTGEWGTFVNASQERPFDIPYRSLVPRDVDDLLVAGRCISATHLGLGGVRGQPQCMATGEAAGAAAALSCRLGVPPRELDVRLLQKRLLEQNVRLFFADEKDRESAVRRVTPLSERLAGDGATGDERA